jgi:type IV secretion system protein VirB6
MIGTCLATGGLNDIAALMASVDCRVEAFVASAYAALYGEAGWLASVITGALTLYVALYGYRMIAGGAVSVPDVTRRFIAFGFVIAFATNWPAYQTAFVNTLTGGAEEIAEALGAATSGKRASAASINEDLGAVLGEMTDLAANWSRKTSGAASVESYAATTGGAAPAPAPATTLAPAGASAMNMLWLSAILFGVSSAGVLVITKISLAFLLALGPLFMLLALFPAMKGLFEGWLRAVAASAFVLVFVLLATAGFLAVIAPMTADLSDQQAVGVNDVEGVFAVTIACIVFALLIRQVLAVAARLVSSWRLPKAAYDVAAGAASEARDIAPTNARESDPRIAAMVAAVSRDAPPAPAAPARATLIAADIPMLALADGRARDEEPRRARRAFRGLGSTRPGALRSAS